jgi:hypothetical protein
MAGSRAGMMCAAPAKPPAIDCRAARILLDDGVLWPLTRTNRISFEVLQCHVREKPLVAFPLGLIDLWNQNVPDIMPVGNNLQSRTRILLCCVGVRGCPVQVGPCKGR